MKSIEHQFLLKAATPIVQGKETRGNVKIINRTEVVLNDGSIREVAEVSGNAMRSGLRRAIAQLTLDSLGLLGEGSFEERDAVRFLFNGGSGSGSDNALRIDDVRAMNALVPSTALLGGSTKGMIHFGRLEVSPATLVCEETLPDLKPWALQALKGREIHPGVVYETRINEYQHDETVKPLGRFLLSAEAQRKLTEQQLKRERAGDSGDEVEAEETKQGMRPYAMQAIKKGSLFSWGVVAHVHNDLEEATLQAMLSAFLRRAVVGAGSRVAQGRFEVFAAADFDHLRPAEAVRLRAASELASAHLERTFIEHIQSRKDEAIGWLRGVSA